MAFPTPNSEWPPKDWQYWFKKYYEWAAWYSGDPEELLRFYSAAFDNTHKNRLWAKMEKEERSEVVHMPLAGDIATMSANLLFSEAPDIQYDRDKGGGDRIADFIKENGLINVLLEASEMSAALSGVYWKLNAVPSLIKLPILTILTPAQVFPEFTYGRLNAATSYRIVKEDDHGKIWRLFEDRRRENGKLAVRFKLYEGTSDKVGKVVAFDAVADVEQIDLVDMAYEMDGLGMGYVPNMRPNKLRPGSALGINDYHGCISLLDSLDAAWTSWMRDIELGMGQIFVDEDLLDENGKYSKLQKAFVKLKMDTAKWSDGGKYEPVKEVQFDIRHEAHQKTCESLVQDIVSRCGYSPQSFGLDIEGRAESGTAMRIRERKSLLTREKKGRYWTPALWEMFWQMQQMDKAAQLTSQSYDPQEVAVVLQDSIIVDPKELSETIRNLDQAKAISAYQKVKTQHPDWDEETVEGEVKRILDESGVTEPFVGMS